MADVGIKISAVDNTKAAFDSVGRNLGNIQASAASVAGALASIGVGISVGAFVEMTKQIVNGLDAMNDLKDATGASIENISALEDVARRTGASFDTVSTSLIKLNQGLNSAKVGSDTEAAIKAIGLSVKDLKALDPAEAFRQIAVGLSAFADDANKARLTQELFGKSLKEVAPLLKDLAESGGLVATVTTQQAEEAEKFNKQLAIMSKTSLDVARDLTGPLISAFNETIAKFKEGAKEGRSFYKVLVDEQLRLLGLNDGPKEYAERLNAISRELESGNIHQSKRNALLREQVAINAKFAAAPDTSYDGAEMARLSRFAKPTVGDLPDQGANKAAAAAAAKALADQNRELAAQAKLIAEINGLSGSFAEDWDRLGAIFKKGGLSLQELTDAQAKLLAGQPGIKAFNDAEVKAAAAIDKANQSAFEAREKYVSSLGDGLEKLQQETTAQQEYNDHLGLSKVAIAELNAEKLESQAIALDLIAIKQLERTEDQAIYDLYKKQAAELRRLAALKVQGSLKESQLDIEREIASERKRGWEQTDQLAREAFTAWAEDGSSAAKKIGDTLKKALLSAIYEATLKPIAFQLYTSVAGGGGAGNAALQAASGATSASSGLNILGSAGTLFGSGFKAGLGAVFGEAGTMGGLSAGTTAIGAGNLAGGFGTLAGTALPWIAGAAILKSLTDYKIDAKGNGITATVGGANGLPSGQVGAFAEFQQTGGLGGGGTTTNRSWSVADQSVATYITANVQAITAANKQYGAALGLTTDAIDGFTKNIEVNLTGLDAAGQKAAIDAELAKFSADQITATYGDALASVAKTGETTGATLERLATDLSSVNSTFDALGYTLYDVSVAGAAAASGLASAFGSLQNFQAQTQALFQNFYTADEQKANAVKNATTTLNAAGITDFSAADISNASREQIRAVVDQYAAKIGTADGDKKYAAVVTAANSISSYVATFDDKPKAPAESTGSSGGGGGGGGSSPVQDAALSAWQDATDAIVKTMGDLRTTLVDSGPDSFVKLQAQFAIESASAKAGNVAAAQDLPALAKSLVDASKTYYTTSVQQSLLTARVIDTLGSVAGTGSAGANLSIPKFASGGTHSGGWAMVGEQGPELAYMPPARIYNANDTRGMLGGGTDPALLEEVRALRAELAAIRANTGSTASSSRKTAQVLDTAANGGQPIGTKAVT